MAGSLENLRFEAPFVVDHEGIRTLHFTHGEVQSSMRLDEPGELLVDYTRTMMGFLLLNPAPRHITMIGLGGGSLAKFCHRHLPRSRITAVENNPGVIALRGQFAVPPDGERFRVLADDGALHVAGAAPGSIDVLLVDGFDRDGQPPQLCSREFYDACFRALAPDGGLLVVNLHCDDPRHEVFLRRIASRFEGNAMEIMAGERFNGVVLAGRGCPVTLEALQQGGGAGRLDSATRRELAAEFARIGWNAHSVPVAA